MDKEIVKLGYRCKDCNAVCTVKISSTQYDENVLLPLECHVCNSRIQIFAQMLAMAVDGSWQKPLLAEKIRDEKK